MKFRLHVVGIMLVSGLSFVYAQEQEVVGTDSTQTVELAELEAKKKLQAEIEKDTELRRKALQNKFYFV